MTVSPVTLLLSVSLSVDVCASVITSDKVWGSLDISAVVWLLFSLSDSVFDSVGISDVLWVRGSSDTLVVSLNIPVD